MAWGKNGYSKKRKNYGNGRKRDRKLTGCRMGTNKNSGRPYITGWNAVGGVMKSFIANPTNDTAKTARGVVREKWVVNLSANGGMSERTVTGFYDPNTGKMYMPDVNMVASLNAPRGGYWGRIKKRR